MLADVPILSLIIASPLAGIMLLIFMPKHKGHWIKTAAIIAASLPLLLALWMYISFEYDTAGMQFTEEKTWMEIPLQQEGNALQSALSYSYQFKYHVAADGIAAVLTVLTAFVTLLAAVAGIYIKKRWKAFYIWLFILEIGMLGVFLARDVVLFFIFFELTLIPAFFLIGIWGMAKREKAAGTFLIYNGLGSGIMLLIFIFLINTAGFQAHDLGGGIAYYTYSGSLDVIMKNLSGAAHTGAVPATWFTLTDDMRTGMYLLLLLAFGIKFPIFPFHRWMLKVHGEAPAAVVMIHSGIMLKMGAYGFIRFGIMLFPEAAASMAWLLAVLGVLNILYGAVLAIVQKEFRLLLAYASVSHMGIVLIGLAAFNVAGFEGALIQMVSHGLIVALLFFIVGVIYERTRTTELHALGGMASSMPFVSGLLLAGGLAALGLPGTSGFVGEFLAFLGFMHAFPVAAVIGALGIILTAVYMLRGVLSITYGQQTRLVTEIRDARFIEAVPMIVLLAVIVLIGIYPAILNEVIRLAVQDFVLQTGGRL